MSFFVKKKLGCVVPSDLMRRGSKKREFEKQKISLTIFKLTKENANIQIFVNVFQREIPKRLSFLSLAAPGEKIIKKWATYRAVVTVIWNGQFNEVLSPTK